MDRASNRRLLVGGEWRASTAAIPVKDPYTGEVIGTAPLGDARLVESAIAAAATAFPKVRAVPPHARASLLARVAERIEARKVEFVETIIAEAGKPLLFAEAEVVRAITTFRVASEEARRQGGEVLDLDAFPSGDGHCGIARRFPIGVIAAITPFNFPLNLVAHKVAPCLATNNTMVVKPSTKTPLTALLLAEVLVEAELPDGQINFVTCDNQAAGILVRDERVKKVTFTGSPAVGWSLKERAGRKRITLELGGNAAVLIHRDADLERAITPIALGAFGHAGQSCISVQRVLVHKAIYDTFRERFIAHIKARVKTGDPRERETIVGPMISEEALHGTLAKIEAARAAGARVVHGGGVVGRCLEATVFEDAAPSLAICAEEAFAPLVTLHRYDDFEDALTLANNSIFGLQAGVFTNDLRLAARAFDLLDVGTVLINQVPTWRVENMPYGGVKQSGFGREGIRYAMDEMTELKSLVFNVG